MRAGLPLAKDHIELLISPGKALCPNLSSPMDPAMSILSSGCSNATYPNSIAAPKHKVLFAVFAAANQNTPPFAPW